MNKRDKVLEELQSIADILEINLDYVVESKREYIICDDTKICTSHTSINGIREEFFGYVILKEWKHRSFGAFDKQTRRKIKEYWYDDDFNQPYLSNK